MNPIEFFKLRRFAWILLAAATLGCPASPQETSSGEPVGEPDPRPNIILIVMDTARMNRLSAYGYDKQTTPNLEDFRKKSRTYTEAYSVSNWTSPSHASMFTGLYPVAHQANQEDWTLRTGLTTLAEILSDEGYETIGFASNAMVGMHYQFNQGFQDYYEPWRKNAAKKLGFTEENAPTTDELSSIQMVRYLRRRQDPRPLFMFVNLIGAHSPYDSCDPFCEEFITDPSQTVVSNMCREYYMGEVSFNEAELQHLNERYDAELKKVDQIVGRILYSLESQGYMDNAMVVITSDHGENIGDHGGEIGHVFTLYDTTCRVPLMVRYPGDPAYEAGSVDEVQAQLVDLFPSILTAAEVDPTLYGPQGLLLSDVEGRAARPGLLELYRPRQILPTYFTDEMSDEVRERVKHYDRVLRAILKDGYKYIVGSDGSQWLYNTAADPVEETNLAEDPEQAERMGSLKAELEAMVEEYAQRATAEAEGAGDDALDSDTRKTLEKLGYLGN